MINITSPELFTHLSVENFLLAICFVLLGCFIGIWFISHTTEKRNRELEEEILAHKSKISLWFELLFIEKISNPNNIKTISKSNDLLMIISDYKRRINVPNTTYLISIKSGDNQALGSFNPAVLISLIDQGLTGDFLDIKFR